MPQDAAVMVIGTKKSDTFDSSLPQVSAQAAALLYYRRGKTPPRGINGSGGPTFFIRTDGERWIFSKMTSEEGVPTVKHSSEFKLVLGPKTSIDYNVAKQIFNWIRYSIIAGCVSLLRAPTEQDCQIVDVQNGAETLAGEFSSVQMDSE